MGDRKKVRRADPDEHVFRVLRKKQRELKGELEYYQRLYRHNLYEDNGYLYRKNQNLQRH